MIPLHKNINIFFKYILSPLLGAWLFYSLYKQIKGQPHLYHSIEMIKQAPLGYEAWKFWSMIILVFVNWGIEAKKWQLLIRVLQPISLLVAFKSVLAGVTLSVNTPNRIGEYAARILFVKEGNRIKAISLSIAGSMSQLIITLFMGCAGLLYIILTKQDSVEFVMGLSFFWIKILLFLSALTAGILVFLYFKLSWLVKIIKKIPAFLKYAHYVIVLEQFHAKVLLRLLSLSLLRYLVFVIQYVLLLQVFNVEILWIQGFWIISILFLVLAIVPSFAIADLGIRGHISTELLKLYSANTIGIIGTTFGVWFINLFIPALAGSILILGIRIFKENK